MIVLDTRLMAYLLIPVPDNMRHRRVEAVFRARRKK